MRGTKQVGIWSEMRSFWQPHPTQDQPAPPEGFEIDSRIGAATPRAPTVSKEDSRPQAILKFHPPSSLDCKGCHTGAQKDHDTLENWNNGKRNKIWNHMVRTKEKTNFHLTVSEFLYHALPCFNSLWHHGTYGHGPKIFLLSILRELWPSRSIIKSLGSLAPNKYKCIPHMRH